MYRQPGEKFSAIFLFYILSFLRVEKFGGSGEGTVSLTFVYNRNSGTGGSGGDITHHNYQINKQIQSTVVDISRSNHSLVVMAPMNN